MAEFRTLDGDDGPADVVVWHGDLVDLKLAPDVPADVVVRLDVLADLTLDVRQAAPLKAVLSLDTTDADDARSRRKLEN